MSRYRRLHWGLWGLTVATWTLSTVGDGAIAATFSHREVEQKKFVAIAVPRQGGYYNLLILEQISSSKMCWKEQGTKPTQIEPLLLKFNFTGICGRSTDSNGYSIRQAGKDLALDYRLSIQKQGNELLLLGMPNAKSKGHPLVIGKTRGLASGFLKIHLDSGWRFTKRVYSGKTLGHIYLTRDTVQPPSTIATQSASPSPTPAPSGGSQAKVQPKPKPVPSSASKPAPSKAPKPAASKSSPVSAKSPSSAPSDRNFYRVLVKTRDSSQQARVRNLVPGAFRSSYQGESVIQVGRFDEKEKAEEMQARMKRSGFQTLLISEQSPKPAAAPPTSSGSKSSPPPTSVLPVPGDPIPIGNAGSGRDIYASTGTLVAGIAVPPPPPPSRVALGPRYRVIVAAGSSDQQARIRGLVPDAFRARYGGQSVMQVGSFTNPTEASDMMKLMERHGFDPILEKT